MTYDKQWNEEKFITRKMMQENPDVLFIFGDNCHREGKGGQAKEMRGEPNALGIVTKARPDHKPDAYLTDKNYEYYKTVIDGDLLILNEELKSGRKVVFPSDGIGTGLAKLKENAPKLYDYLQNRIAELKKKYA